MLAKDLYINLKRVLLLATAYFFAGKVSLLLAIPPGYTTALFLSIGIGLGATLIWGRSSVLGVLLGSTFLNLSLSGFNNITLSSLAIAIEIACGSSIAVLVGNYLIKRIIGFPNPLTDERKIFLFLLLGGPIATTLSASIGVLSLWLNGAIPTHYITESWFTWWVGDALGVLIATPLMCVFFAKPRRLWSSRKIIVGIPVSISCAIVVAIFVRTSDEEQKHLTTTFHQQTQLMTSVLQNNFDNALQTLESVRALFLVSPALNSQQFSTYINSINIDKRGLSYISWNRLITNDERLAFEQRIQTEGYPNFKILDRTANKEFVVAENRPQYVPITYMEPWAPNKMAHGFDVYNEPIRYLAIKNSMATKLASMTQPIQLVQDPSGSLSTLIFLPVYHNETINQQHENKPAGFVVAILRIPRLLSTSFENFDRNSYNIRIIDTTNTDDPIVFHDEITNIEPHAESLVWVETINVGLRKLTITIAPRPAFIAKNSNSNSWLTLAGGLLFSSLLGGFLLLVSGRTEHINNLVAVQTQELASILDNAVESIFVTDSEGIILRANRAAESLFFNKINTPLLNNPIYEFIPTLHDYFNGHLQSLTTGLALTGNISANKYRDEVVIELSVSRIEIDDRVLFTFIVHDISKRKKVENLKTEFISTVSHELRTPLTSIKGSIGLIQSGALGDIPEKMSNMLSIANNNVDRLTRLVNDILDIEKLEFGDLELTLTYQEILPLLETALAHNHSYAEKYSVRFKLMPNTAEEAHIKSNINTDRFLQVMSNLLSNAAKFSHPNDEIIIQFSADQANINVMVTDQGQGIPQEYHKHIFQKFLQVDSSDKRRHEGSGLGLSISKAIIEQFGGSIHFTSQQGIGSSFSFTLPRVYDDMPTR